MIRKSSSFKFFFTKVTKGWRKGKPSLCLEFHEHSDDKELCIVNCMDKYFRRSASWRTIDQNQLLLSHLRPYKEVQSSTTAVTWCPGDVPWRSLKGSNAWDAQRSFRGLLGDQHKNWWFNEKKCFLDAIVLVLYIYYCIFTGKKIFKSSKWGCLSDVYGT